MTDKAFFEKSMQLVVERAKLLAIQRIYAHREYENGSQKREKKGKESEPLR